MAVWAPYLCGLCDRLFHGLQVVLLPSMFALDPGFAPGPAAPRAAASLQCADRSCHLCRVLALYHVHALALCSLDVMLVRCHVQNGDLYLCHGAHLVTRGRHGLGDQTSVYLYRSEAYEPAA